jgi:methyl-accepting chemotaxis protein
MKKFQLRLGAKFALVLGALAAVILVVGLSGLSGLGSMHTKQNDLGAEVEAGGKDGYVIGKLNQLGGVIRYYTVTDSDQPELKKKLHDQLAELFPALTSGFAEMEKRYAGDPSHLALVKQLESAFTGLEEPWKTHAYDTDTDAEDPLLAKITPFIDAADADGKKLQARTIAQGASVQKSADSKFKSTRALVIAFLLIGLAAAAALAVLLVRNIVPRVREYAGFTHEVAKGDLTARVDAKGHDELADLGGSLNEMVENLAGMSGQVLSGAESISAAAGQILTSVNEQTAGANEQSAAINQTTTATEEIRASAGLAAEKAEEVAAQALDAVRVSQEGSEAVDAIVAGMSDIREKVEAIASDVQALSEQTAQIEEITGAVNDLADQSNLLALNATIEAARAGEQGKGFAVVADQVRNLAEQSKEATGQVQTILEEIERATRAAVVAAQQGTEVVEHGTRLAERAGEIIAQLAQANGIAAQSAEQIAASVSQQNAGMDQISQGMQETSRATDEFVNGIQQSQQAAESLNQLAGNLQQLAAQYNV